MTPEKSQEFLAGLRRIFTRMAAGVREVTKIRESGKDKGKSYTGVEVFNPLSAEERKNLRPFVFSDEFDLLQSATLPSLVATFAPDPRWQEWAELQEAADSWEKTVWEFLQNLKNAAEKGDQDTMVFLAEQAADFRTRKSLQKAADDFAATLPPFSVSSLALLPDSFDEDGGRKKGLLSLLAECAVNPTGEYSASAPWSKF